MTLKTNFWTKSLALLCALCLIMILLAGCGGFDSSYSVSVNGLTSKETLKLRIKCRKAGLPELHRITMIFNGELKDIRDKIIKQVDETVLTDEQLVITRDNRIYSIIPIDLGENAPSPAYILRSSAVIISGKWSSYTRLKTMVPLHLMDDAIYGSIQADEEISYSGEKQDVIDFYRDHTDFTAQEGADQITINHDTLTYSIIFGEKTIKLSEVKFDESD